MDGSSPNSYVEGLISNVTIFGARAFKELLNEVIWVSPNRKGLVSL